MECIPKGKRRLLLLTHICNRGIPLHAAALGCFERCAGLTQRCTLASIYHYFGSPEPGLALSGLPIVPTIDVSFNEPYLRTHLAILFAGGGFVFK
jgi:hypothetical protein